MQAGEVWPWGGSNLSSLSSLCGTFSKPEFSNKPSPGCVPRMKPQHQTPHYAAQAAGAWLVHVCPDLLGSLADETRGETEQVADGNLQTGRDASFLSATMSQGGVWPAGNFMPIDKAWN